jgi:PPE-repeat protein
MVPAFFWFPPEINSTLMFSGAGPGPLLAAASAWTALGSDLSVAASSFYSVISGLTSGLWTGPASLSMAAAAAPYVGWLNAAAAQAEAAAAQALAAATAFETAQAATVLPAAVTANRVTLMTLIATNFLGQNTPAIAMTDVGSRCGRDGGVSRRGDGGGGHIAGV